MSKSILVEKSPQNLIMTRFLQALFPEAYFVIAIRHPIPSAVATRRWDRWTLRGLAPTRLLQLVEHWLHGYEIFLADAPHLAPDRVVLVRYEDLVADPEATLRRLFAFLGPPPAQIAATVDRAVNETYFRRWRGSRWNPVCTRWHTTIARRLETRTNAFGYSLETPERTVSPARAVQRLLLRSR